LPPDINLKFVHAADIHLDSPLSGLDNYEGAPVDRIRGAAREALQQVVQLCLDEQADLLIIAGDLFDTACNDFNSALNAANQLRPLAKAGIPVYLILGNHDSHEEMVRRTPWPDNVILFAHQRAETHRHPRLPVALHGLSYPKRAVTENVVPGYPAPLAEFFNIGLLHTNADGNPNHDSYAPCSVSELVAKGYDYWALGHVHDHAILHEKPHVVYSGNTQGRHAREIGPKGCVVVSVNGGEITSLRFHETDAVRWFRQLIVLDADDGGEELVEKTRRVLRELVQSVDSRLAVVRLEYTGRCRLHQQLTRDTDRQQMMTNIRSLALDFDEAVWIEKIKFRTQSPIDVDALRQRHDLVGELLQDLAEARNNPERIASLAALLQPLAAKVNAPLEEERAVTTCDYLADPDRLAGWLADAEALLLELLAGDAT